jgi:3-hydroxy-5-methyl-1-naphthoate 3-O-methyltransferase
MILTAAPATDPLPLYRYRDGLYAVDLLTALIVHFDFFSRLGEDTLTERDLAERFGFASRPLDVALTLLVANGLVHRTSTGICSTAMAREHCTTGSGWDLTPYYASLHDRPIARDYIEVLRTGRPAGWSGDKSSADWHAAMEDETFARKFTAAMDCRGRLLAQALAKKLDLTGRSRVLDIGGGSGIYACSLVAENSALSGCVLEQQPVDRITARLIEERGFADRVQVCTSSPTCCMTGICLKYAHCLPLPRRPCPQAAYWWFMMPSSMRTNPAHSMWQSTLVCSCTPLRASATPPQNMLTSCLRLDFIPANTKTPP